MFHAIAAGLRQDGIPRPHHDAWRAFLDDPGSLLQRADVIAREGLGSGGSAVSDSMVSRGPVPFEGTLVSTRVADDAHHLYLLMLCVAGTKPKWFKLGISRDVPRRICELNEGFPPKMGMRWRLIAAQRFADGWLAHRAEQQLLSRIAAEGLSAGGEFLELDFADALILLPVLEAGSVSC
ncbi:hypothetical protein BWQ93_03285 [Sphingopyxis sp. QXT-31]|nr:hypothetical protein BWQ93_03285 [Sphingopyxis sp. QXT-31]